MANIVKIKDINFHWDNLQATEYNKELNTINIIGIGWVITFASTINPTQKVHVRLTPEEFNILKEYILEKQEGYRII